MADITEDAIQQGIDSFMATFGRLPPNFSLMAEHMPGAFAGYGLLRSFAMRAPAEGGALDRRTKELVMVLLDTLLGQTTGAKEHATVAMKLGLTLPELADGLSLVLMVGGITTWNATGADVMRHCIALQQAVQPTDQV